MPVGRRYFNLDPTPQNLRALWDKLYQIEEAVTAANTTIRSQAETIASLQTNLTRTQRTAKAALSGSIRLGAAGGGGTPIPIDTMPIPNHLVDVQAIWTAAQPTVNTLEWGFARTRELAWQFRNEIVEGVPFAMGLLLSGGANLYTCNGITYKVGRVIYPNGHVFKILTDIPGTMNPSWQDDSFVDPQRYSPATDPSVAC